MPVPHPLRVFPLAVLAVVVVSYNMGQKLSYQWVYFKLFTYCFNSLYAMRKLSEEASKMWFVLLAMIVLIAGFAVSRFLE